MTKQIREYLAHLQEFLEAEHTRQEYAQELERLRVRIGFFSHERLVHMFIMLAFAIFFLLTLFQALTAGTVGVYILAVLFLVLLVPYIKHYYFLENSVQKMYLIYNRIEQLAGGAHEQ